MEDLSSNPQNPSEKWRAFDCSAKYYNSSAVEERDRDRWGLLILSLAPSSVRDSQKYKVESDRGRHLTSSSASLCTQVQAVTYHRHMNIPHQDPESLT